MNVRAANRKYISEIGQGMMYSTQRWVLSLSVKNGKWWNSKTSTKNWRRILYFNILQMSFYRQGIFQAGSSVTPCHRGTNGGRHMNFTTGIMMANGAETT